MHRVHIRTQKDTDRTKSSSDSAPSVSFPVNLNYKLEYPIRYSSTSLAQSRPCRIAFTTSD